MLTVSKNRIIFLILFLFTFLGTGSSYAKCSPTLHKDIQQIIDEARSKYGIPGLQVSIGCPGEEHPRNFVSGTTTHDGATLVTPDTLFQIGSSTKSFTAAILLRLEADRLLFIDEPIGKYLTHIRELPQEWKKITIEQLLNHTSGIVNYLETEEFQRIWQDSKFKKKWTPEELIQFAFNKSYFEPGQGFHYSNTNYILAGMIISAVTGKSVEEAMEELLSNTLPPSNTYYLPHPYSKDIMARMAHGYYPSEQNNPPIDTTDDNMSAAGAAGAMVSNSENIAIWIRKLLTTTSVLPEKQRNEMMSLVDMENGQRIPITSKKTGYGLGVAHSFNSGTEAWQHGGSTRGYLTEMLWLTCHEVVITTTININSPSSFGLLADLNAYFQKSDSLNQCKIMDIPKQSSEDYWFKTLN